MNYSFAAIVVTHNSQLVIDRCLSALLAQSLKISQIVLVDSGSENSDYLEQYKTYPQITFVDSLNIGFSKANNLGMSHVRADVDYVLLINPDLFVPEDFTVNLQKSIEHNQDFGILTGKLLGYDCQKNSKTDRIDSAGVFRKWYGRWYDRGQGEKDLGKYDNVQEVPAVCGAMMCIPKTVVDKYKGRVFHPDFFMYKEDIELSLRLRKDGLSLRYDPEVVAWHCRGWQQQRRKMPRLLKEQSAVNEVRIYLIHPSIYIVWAIAKLVIVKLFRL